MNLIRVTDAISEAFALQVVKSQLRITTTADDESFRQFIAAIRHKTEWYCQRSLITTEWQYSLDEFEPEILLPMGPVQSITSIEYTDTDGATQTFTDFQFDRKGRLMPAYGFSWPSTRPGYDAVRINYVCGEIEAGMVPEDIKQAMLLWIGSLDVGRENTVIGAGIVTSEIPGGAKSLLAPHKLQAV